MPLASLRGLVAAHCKLWCAAAVCLVLLLPFIAVHFRCDGLEDEPALRLHSADATVQFEADDRADHPADRETTVYAQPSASIDAPNALSQGLDLLLALAMAMTPLTVVLLQLLAPIERRLPARVPTLGGAPPQIFLRRRRPPPTAPPCWN